MTTNSQAKYEAGAKIMKSLAHPARLLIIDMLLEKGECCVFDRTKAIGTDMSTVSRHLAQLKNVGIIRSEKRGQMVFYRIHVKCIACAFRCIESVAKSNVEEHAQVLETPGCGCHE